MTYPRIGIAIVCSLCGYAKKPIGRSAPHAWHGCDHECPGYGKAPLVGSLWPGESSADFGYPVGDEGTEPE